MKKIIIIGFLCLITTGFISAQNNSVDGADFTRPDLVRRFEIHVPAKLDSMMKKGKGRNASSPDAITG